MDLRHAPERLVHRIEKSLEEGREQIVARQVEAEAAMDEWWAEARERERRLAEAVSHEEEEEHSAAEAKKERKIAFVVHTRGAGEALEAFADGRARLVRVVSGRRGYGGLPGFGGSWLIFEDAGRAEEGGSR